MPASSCGFRLKDFELSIQDESEVQLYNLSVGLLQCSRSGVHRKVGNVALISPTGTRTRPDAGIGQRLLWDHQNLVPLNQAQRVRPENW
jgi:hypothetical protein